MSQPKDFHEISHRDAFATIGLHQKDESTYYLANIIIELVNDGLKLTYLSRPTTASPDQSHHTSIPLRYTHNKIEYLIANEDQKLVVYEQDNLVGN